MAQSLNSGTYFELEGVSNIKLFGLLGSHSGNNWVVGINLGGKKPSYIPTVVSPAPALADVISVIDQDRAKGKLKKIARVVISNRVAVRLFLDGTLKATDFEGAEESKMKTSSFIEGGKKYPSITLKGVMLGQDTFPVTIMSEFHIGSGTIATIDAKGELV